MIYPDLLFDDFFSAIQCENGTEYSACVDPCPEDSCDSIKIGNSVAKECKKLKCVEGLTFLIITGVN